MFCELQPPSSAAGVVAGIDKDLYSIGGGWNVMVMEGVQQTDGQSGTIDYFRVKKK